MKVIKLPLFWKYVIALVSIVAVFGSINTYLIQKNVFNYLEEATTKRAYLIGNYLSSEIVHLILYEDYVAVQNKVFTIQKNDSSIVYIFLSDENDKVLVHKFEDLPPKSLITANRVSNSGSINKKIISDKANAQTKIIDIAFPVMEGRLGTLRIGITESLIQKDIQSIVNVFWMMVLLFLVFGIVGALLFSSFISKPITSMQRIAELLDLKSLKLRSLPRVEIRKSRFDYIYLFKTKDEIDILAEKFNVMIERLEATYEALAKSQMDLIQSEKLASLGVLVAGIAHEVNNPIAGIQNCIRRIALNQQNKEQTEKYLKLMNDATIRISNVMQGLLKFSRKEEIEMRIVDINMSIDDALNLVGYQLEQNRIVIVRNEINKIAFFGSHNLIVQVLLNILLNSIDSIEQRIKKQQGCERKITITTWSEEGKNIVMVADTGEGIKAEIKDRIFDPFFTTKDTGKGTGLGLSITYNIMQYHSGEIKVESEVNEGTKFYLILPEVKN